MLNRLAAVALLAVALPLTASAQTAPELMKVAHDGRAVWQNFPGFTADLVALNSSGANARGTLVVSASGDVKIESAASQPLPEWVEKTLKSVVGHRLSDDGAITKVDFADEDKAHPMGRLLKSTEENDHSQYRVKGDLMTEVHRNMGKTRFIISVADVSRTQEGKHLPRNFTVTTWDAQGALVSARQVNNEWTRVGAVDLPVRLLATTSKSDGTRTVEEITLSKHTLGGAPVKVSVKTAAGGTATVVAVAAVNAPANDTPANSTSANSAVQIREITPLPASITSQGAAVLGGKLYLYGGWLGSPHEYNAEEQVKDLQVLDLKKPEKWETISTGPRRTGLAMVAHGGKLYRIGGWEARPAEAKAGDKAAGDKADAKAGEKKWELFSTPDFARFDPATGKWQDLAPMPAGRSSHDAAVLGNKLYVIGGWALAGAGDGTWHSTALVCDLSAADPQWSEIAKPNFKRRALSVAAYNGKIYAIGGMTDSHEMHTGLSVYDPATNAWTDGPKLAGQPIEGFGTSAFGTKDGLFVTTPSGAIYRLANDGKAWNQIGKLQHPRFFHRVVADDDGTLIVVGGTSRAGKIKEVEVLRVSGG